MSDWPHQTQAVADVLAAIQRGVRRLCLTSPTGGGKSRIMQRLIEHWLGQDKKVVLYTNRKLLLEQISSNFARVGIDHGIKAAGYYHDPDAPLQIASIQTEHSRAMKRKFRKLHPADFVLVDEGHLFRGDVARAVLDQHWNSGAAVVMVTATPLDMEHLCDELIVAGTTSELRACGALVPAYHYGPDEPDWRQFKSQQDGDTISEEESRCAIMRPGIWGRVLESFQSLNPQHLPTLLFAPGVPESIWFAQQFQDAGIPAAHIDGQDVWVDGRLETSDPELRADVLERSREGSIRVLCNRFVLREGIDCPWLRHGIFATVFGSVQSYLQSGGRLLRAYPGKESVTIQDHGGNWWRYGSLNADREWDLRLTARSVGQLRADRLRDKKAGNLEPYRCPNCQMILTRATCVCGYKGGKRARAVIMADGTMKQLGGAIYPPRRTYGASNGPALWEKMYWRSRTEKGRRTFRQAMALFAREHNWGWPDMNWPFMPKNPLDLSRYVCDVPISELIPKG